MSSLRAKFKRDGPHGGKVFLVPVEKSAMYLHSEMGNPVVRKDAEEIHKMNTGKHGTQARGSALYEEVGGHLARFCHILYWRVQKSHSPAAVTAALEDLREVASSVYGLKVIFPDHVTKTQIKRALVLAVRGHYASDAAKKEAQFESISKQMDSNYAHAAMETCAKWVLDHPKDDGTFAWLPGFSSSGTRAAGSESLNLDRDDCEKSLSKGGVAYICSEMYRNTSNPMFALAGGRSH